MSNNKIKWTVLTYIAAHNNLDALGKKSLDEILKVGSSDDVVHGALYDGPAGAARYVMGDPGYVKHQEQLGKSFDSGDPDELIATAKWLFRAVSRRTLRPRALESRLGMGAG